MTNLDKYFDELMRDKYPCELIRDIDVKYEDCDECPFDRDTLCFCNKGKFKAWLLEEHKETIKLTLHEKCILESLPNDYKYIARDKDGELYIYKHKPIKDQILWLLQTADDRECKLQLFNHLFKFINWDDDEPYKIEDILKNCEVVEND